MGKCKECGGNTLPGQEYCMNCKPQSNPRGHQRGGGQRGGQPRGGGYRQDDRPHRDPPGKQYFRDSFYDADGYLKREVFIEAAEEARRRFQKVTQSQIRQLFQMLKDAEKRMDVMPEVERPGFIREQVGKFLTFVEYQTGRNVIKEPEFRQFIRSHSDLASSSEREFRGFLWFLTAILARMKTK